MAIDTANADALVAFLVAVYSCSALIIYVVVSSETIKGKLKAVTFLPCKAIKNRDRKRPLETIQYSQYCNVCPKTRHDPVDCSRPIRSLYTYSNVKQTQP